MERAPSHVARLGGMLELEAGAGRPGVGDGGVVGADLCFEERGERDGKMKLGLVMSEVMMICWC